jgi:hypothetical protein
MNAKPVIPPIRTLEHGFSFTLIIDSGINRIRRFRVNRSREVAH